mmetsp:Transcript_71195/g.153530  ORF Transcript_71195/g.153530 Transcript_71195/m.153530 type:complete len:755 (+) Transcript_71195:873-3137(+)
MLLLRLDAQRLRPNLLLAVAAATHEAVQYVATALLGLQPARLAAAEKTVEDVAGACGTLRLAGQRLQRADSPPPLRALRRGAQRRGQRRGGRRGHRGACGAGGRVRPRARRGQRELLLAVLLRQGRPHLRHGEVQAAVAGVGLVRSLLLREGEVDAPRRTGNVCAASSRLLREGEVEAGLRSSLLRRLGGLPSGGLQLRHLLEEQVQAAGQVRKRRLVLRLGAHADADLPRPLQRVQVLPQGAAGVLAALQALQGLVHARGQLAHSRTGRRAAGLRRQSLHSLGQVVERRARARELVLVGHEALELLRNALGELLQLLLDLGALGRVLRRRPRRPRHAPRGQLLLDRLEALLELVAAVARRSRSRSRGLLPQLLQLVADLLQVRLELLLALPRAALGGRRLGLELLQLLADFAQRFLCLSLVIVVLQLLGRHLLKLFLDAFHRCFGLLSEGCKLLAPCLHSLDPLLQARQLLARLGRGGGLRGHLLQALLRPLHLLLHRLLRLPELLRHVLQLLPERLLELRGQLLGRQALNLLGQVGHLPLHLRLHLLAHGLRRERGPLLERFELRGDLLGQRAAGLGARGRAADVLQQRADLGEGSVLLGTLLLQRLEHVARVRELGAQLLELGLQLVQPLQGPLPGVVLQLLLQHLHDLLAVLRHGVLQLPDVVAQLVELRVAGAGRHLRDARRGGLGSCLLDLALERGDPLGELLDALQVGLRAHLQLLAGQLLIGDGFPQAADVALKLRQLLLDAVDLG